MLNMNFAERVVVDTRSMQWQPSPMAGVERKPLARESAESGHATSIVRYAAGSRFAAHRHPGGEEIFVLEGVFSDESGDYPAGSYIRNPPGSSHAPYSQSGCTLFVKLGQFAEGDTATVRIVTLNAAWLRGHGGLEVMPLHTFQGEHTALVRWPKGERFAPHSHFGGEEVLVLSGTFMDEYGEYPRYCWLRSPHLSRHHPFVKDETLLLVKTGHLPAP
ncbi:anti-ECFsigma factor, ChrR [Microbulbifer donghaiensis]|uniref:Anti-ECFsigma factor, ChrR n=1 Tax=Microbulbifer donghaiensis TaxID=494016 RepID=A0A1M5ANN3_9GAMM|nr:cupin domain-containing protein [Microbulbifer donghaiensis]SHF31764.1 anti-ECFsigma factor, ChrR [Microbulbifer donghaiensis]